MKFLDYSYNCKDVSEDFELVEVFFCNYIVADFLVIASQDDFITVKVYAFYKEFVMISDDIY